MPDYSEDRDTIEAIKANSARIVNPGSIETLFSPEFMQARSNFDGFDGFLTGAPSPMEFPEGDLLRAPEGWDTYVAEHTSFKDVAGDGDRGRTSS